MVTGASTADLSVILIDARKGVLTQTRRHSFLVSLLGIRHVVLAVNKMDLVDYAQPVFEAIEADYRKFASELGLPTVTCIPISGVKGDNIVRHSAATPWYQGPDADGPARHRRDRRDPGPRAAAASPDPVGESAQPGLSRLRRDDRRRPAAGKAMRSASSRRAG